MNRRLENDPLIFGGKVVCHLCGRVSYPVDAEWMHARLILVTYSEGCSHETGNTWLFDLDAPDLPSRWCGASTKAGDPCRNRASEPGQSCHLHDPARKGGR